MNGESIRVLVVEDNPHDALLVQRLLQKSVAPRFEVTVTKALADALLSAHSASCDAILLDLSLPDSNGLAGLYELALAVPSVPIIVLTGLEDEKTHLQALRSGAQDYLLKNRTDSAQLCRAILHAIERKAFESRLAQQALFDHLTGLGNRYFFEERLESAIARARRIGGRIALMFIDLDGFKLVNDTRGHAAGDRVLQLVAEHLRAAVRDGETIARLGGDEFTVLLDPVHDSVTTESAVKRISREFQNNPLVPEDDIRVTLSIGVAIFPDHASDAKALLRNADMAMFHAKSLGRSNFQLYDSNLGFVMQAPRRPGDLH